MARVGASGGVGAEEFIAGASCHRRCDQLGHSKVSMTQDRYLGRRLTDRETAEVLEGLVPGDGPIQEKGPKSVPGS